MREDDFFKKMLEEEIFQKEQIKNNVIQQSKREDIYMKRKLATVASIVLVFVITLATYIYADAKEYNKAMNFLSEIGVEEGMLSRNEVKRVYKDIKSNSFDETVTNIVLGEIAEKLGIEGNLSSPKELYESIKTYNMLTYTKKISSDDVMKITAGMTYKDIIKTLGETKDLGGKENHMLIYVVDGNKLLYLSFNKEEDICDKTGEELLNTLVNSIQDNKDRNSFNGTVFNRSNNTIYVLCPTNDQFDSIYVSITEDTEIVFSNGAKATIEDIEGNVTITITGGIRESYPPQSTAKKIVINN